MLFLITHTDRLASAFAGQDWEALVFIGLDLMLAPSTNKKVELTTDVFVQIELNLKLELDLKSAALLLNCDLPSFLCLIFCRSFYIYFLHFFFFVCLSFYKNEEINVREWISYTGVPFKVMPLKLFLDVVTSLSFQERRS